MLLNASYAWIIGALAARVWLGRSCLDENRALARALSSAMVIGICVCFATILLSLWQAAATMADIGLLEVRPTLLTLFATTHYGLTGMASLALIAAVGLLQVLSNRLTRGSLYMMSAMALLLLFAVARVRIGHAYEFGPLSIAAVTELVHLLSMALWSGSVFIAAWVVIPHLADAQSNNAGTGYLRALSHGATIALAGVLASGLYNAYRVLNTPGELLATQYGWVLSAKICFVLLAVVLGGWNRFFGFPDATAGDAVDRGNNRFRTVLPVLRFESIALVIVLIAAAILTGSAPPSTT